MTGKETCDRCIAHCCRLVYCATHAWQSAQKFTTFRVRFVMPPFEKLPVFRW